MLRQFSKAWFRGDEAAWRKETGDFVNLFWPNLAHWSCMLWDPKGFPTMIYELNKEDGAMTREILQFFPRHMKLMIKLLFPKKLSKVKDMKNWSVDGRHQSWSVAASWNTLKTPLRPTNTILEYANALTAGNLRT